MRLSGKDIAVIASVCGLTAAGIAYTRIKAAFPAPQLPALPKVQDVAHAPQVDRAQELARFQTAREKLKKHRPKDETEILSMLGEPSSVMDADTYKMVHWYYETKDVGRDVIAANIERNGRVSLVQY